MEFCRFRHWETIVLIQLKYDWTTVHHLQIHNILIKLEYTKQLLFQELHYPFNNGKRKWINLTALIYLLKPPASLSSTLNIIQHEHLLNVFELKCKWFFNGLGDLQSVTVHLFFMFFPLSFCACVSQTPTMKTNEVAPMQQWHMNKAPVPLMDHVDIVCSISINRQWNDMK